MLHVVEVLKKKNWGPVNIYHRGGGGGEWRDGRGFEGESKSKEFSGGTEGGSNVTNKV